MNEIILEKQKEPAMSAFTKQTRAAAHALDAAADQLTTLDNLLAQYQAAAEKNNKTIGELMESNNLQARKLKTANTEIIRLRTLLKDRDIPPGDEANEVDEGVDEGVDES